MNRHRLFFALLAGVLAGFGLAGRALSDQVELDRNLNEKVLTLKKSAGFFSTELEVTLFRPEGDGPFPVALINHGKAAGDPRFQPRYRPMSAARYFLQRGYAVVVPMRQGFSKSTGLYIGAGCNVESNGLVQAEDVKAVLDQIVQEPWADKGKIVMVGQSHGGLTTLAFGTLNYPGVRGLVNFAGGLRHDACPGWEFALAKAVGEYARQTPIPSLWFYGDNDSYFKPFTWQAMHEKYMQGGGRAQLVAFGNFGSDAHFLFGAAAGEKVWQPEVSRFLDQLGMPSTVQAHWQRYAAKPGMPSPPSTGFAPLDDAAAIPFVREAGRAGYRQFLSRPLPRAFAISPRGAWAWNQGGDDPLARALSNCNRFDRGECRLYAVDDEIVWRAPEP